MTRAKNDRIGQSKGVLLKWGTSSSWSSSRKSDEMTIGKTHPTLDFGQNQPVVEPTDKRYSQKKNIFEFRKKHYSHVIQYQKLGLR